MPKAKQKSQKLSSLTYPPHLNLSNFLSPPPKEALEAIVGARVKTFYGEIMVFV